MLDVFRAVGGDHVRARVAWAFEAMAIVEGLMEGRDVPRGTFAVLCPPPEFPTGGAELYRAHARELIDRACRREDTRPGTVAQAVFVMSEASLKAPLAHWAGDFMVWLWRKAELPERFVAGVTTASPTSAGDREFEAELAQLRRKLSKPDRVIR